MKPNGVQAALARRAVAGFKAFLFGLAALLATPALAGDRAEINIIGYSKDASHFAFEEFGFQDGSGFAYSNLYILELAGDRWVAGSPFRAQADNEGTSLADIRLRTRLAADSPMRQLDLVYPATLVALIGDGQRDRGSSLSFGLPGYGTPGLVNGSYRLQVETFPAYSAEACTDYLGEMAKGYALSIVVDGFTREIHRDRTVPASRKCPTAYRLYGVVTPAGAEDLQNAVAVVSVYSFGFEGPDRRFIAVPLGLEP